MQDFVHQPYGLGFRVFHAMGLGLGTSGCKGSLVVLRSLLLALSE